jgi:hypothetical protein
MKPLNEKQKENMFDDIVKSISYIYKPAPGEFTLQMLVDAIQEKDPDISMNKIRHRVYKLVNAEILGVRDITGHGSRTKVYFPLGEHSHEEILEVLLES